MSKHIKIIAKLSENRKRVFLSIIEQTHRGPDFGTGGKDFGYNGVTLRSNFCPCWDTSANTLFVRGWGEDKDHKEVYIHIDKWPRVKEAVEAYNAYFK